jgi:hypothetical protein
LGTLKKSRPAERRQKKPKIDPARARRATTHQQQGPALFITTDEMTQSVEYITETFFLHVRGSALAWSGLILHTASAHLY